MNNQIRMKLTTRLSFFCVVLLCWSCNSDLEKSLKLAGENRPELEKVMAHFEDDADPLKHEAAELHIENMGSHCYSPDSGMSKMDMVFDAKVMKADYLIKVITDACDAWNRSSWRNDYDKSIFFEYVLPYRLAQEPISDWREMLRQEYPLLKNDVVLSLRGTQYEAEDGLLAGCEAKAYEGASKGKAEMMFPETSSVSYMVASERSTQKRLMMRYASVARDPSVAVRVNDSVINTIHLAPTRDMESFSEKWSNFALPFNNGKNVISLVSASDTLCLDYIQLGAVEPFKRRDLAVYKFSDIYYSIENFETRQYLSFDPASYSKYQAIGLKPYSDSDSTQLLRVDYAGYALWNVDGYKKDLAGLRPFGQWVFFPLGIDLYRIMDKQTGLFLDTEKDAKTGREFLVRKPFSKSWTQEWVLHRRDKNPYADQSYKVGSAKAEAKRVFDMKCADESFSVLLCRYLGIPATYDFTPYWKNSSKGYSWGVFVNSEAKATPFYNMNSSSNAGRDDHLIHRPKVFRYRYSINKDMVKDFSSETSVPSLFINPHYTDVTSEYGKTTDVERSVSSRYNDRVVYICVLDHRTWVPVYYGKTADGRVTFKAMGRDFVYMTGIWEKGRIKPIGEPFWLTNDGRIVDQR